MNKKNKEIDGSLSPHREIIRHDKLNQKRRLSVQLMCLNVIIYSCSFWNITNQYLVALFSSTISRTLFPIKLLLHIEVSQSTFVINSDWLMIFFNLPSERC